MRYDPVTNTKICSKCKETKPISAYGNEKRRFDGLSNTCKQCHSNRVNKYIKALPKERKKTQRDAWRAQNPDKVKADAKSSSSKIRANKLGIQGKFTAQEWLDLLAATGSKCLCCGATGDLEADHVVPLAQGGTNTIDNIQPLCRKCNATKGEKSTDYRS